jgi:hypothetical protein
MMCDMKFKLLMAMLLALGACGGSSSKSAAGAGKKKGKVAKVEKVEKVDDDGEAASGDEGAQDEEGSGKKKPKKGSASKSWGSGKSRTCLDLSRLPDGASSTIAAAFEKDVLRVCREAKDDDGNDTRACIGMDPTTGRASKVSKKPLAAAAEALPEGALKMDGEKPEACSSDGKCRTLGKKAAKAVVAAMAAEGATATVTADASIVAVAGASREVWNVAKDKAIKLKAPRAVTAEYARQVTFRAVGKNLFAQWNPCVGPCNVARVYDVKGKVVINDLATEGVPHALDATRWMMANAELDVFELASGKRQHAIRLFPEAPTYIVDGTTYKFNSPEALPARAVLLGDGLVAVLFNEEPVVAIANVETGKVEARYRLPLCDDPDARKDAEQLGSEPEASSEAGSQAGEGEQAEASEKSEKSEKKSSKKKSARSEEE